jgi:hypothetical protein
MAWTLRLRGFGAADRARAEADATSLDSALRDRLDGLRADLGEGWTSYAEHQGVHLRKEAADLAWELHFFDMQDDTWQLESWAGIGSQAGGQRRGWMAAGSLVVCFLLLGGLMEGIQSMWPLLGVPLIFIPSIVILRNTPERVEDPQATAALQVKLRSALQGHDWIDVLSEG